jgi:L-galactose dehydrogenase
MEFRTLGRTGLSVSVMGFGASPLGDVFGVVDMAEITSAVHCAIDNGINYFDVSPYYGKDALAEERLGKALEGGWRNRALLATKVGQYNWGGVKTNDYSERSVFDAVEGSLRRLRTDRIDVYQAHDIHFTTTEQVIGETLPAMRKLQAQGKIRYIGITDYQLEILKTVLEHAEVDTVLTFCCCNLIDTSFDAVLAPMTEAKRIGVINASPLHMGLLVDKPRQLLAYGQTHDNPLTRAVARAAALCAERGTTLSDLAMRFAFAYPGTATVLSGLSKRRNVERNLAAVGKTPDPDLLGRVRKLLVEAVDPGDPFGFKDG